MKRNTKQLIAIAISVVMIIGMFPMIAFADWDLQEEKQVNEGDEPPVEEYLKLEEGQTVDDVLPETANDGAEIWVHVGDGVIEGGGEGKEGFQKVIGHDKVYEKKEGTDEKAVFQEYEGEDAVDFIQERAIDGDGNPLQDFKYDEFDMKIILGTIPVKKLDKDGEPIKNLIGPEMDYSVIERLEDFVESGTSGADGTNGWNVGTGGKVPDELSELDIGYDQNNDILYIPGDLIVTLRYQVDNNYFYVDVSGPKEIHVKKSDHELSGNNHFILDTRPNMLYEYEMEDKNIYEMIDLFHRYTNKDILSETEFDEYEDLFYSIFQRFVWVAPGPPIGEEEEEEEEEPEGDPGGRPGGYFEDPETGETFTVEEVLAIFLPPAVPADEPEEEIVAITPPAVPLAPTPTFAPARTPADVAEADEIDIEEPEVPLAPGPQGLSPYLWLLTLLLLLLLIPILRRRRTVEYVNEMGEELYKEKVKYGSYLEMPENQIPNAQSIKGWFRDNDYREMWNFDEDKIRKNIQLFAKFDK